MQIHSAHEFGVLARQDVEGAVREGDVVAFGAWFEAGCVKYPQCDVSGVLVLGGGTRGADQFLAQLVSMLVELGRTRHPVQEAGSADPFEGIGRGDQDEQALIEGEIAVAEGRATPEQAELFPVPRPPPPQEDSMSAAPVDARRGAVQDLPASR